MRILHLSWEYPPVMYGGLGRHVHALAETQAAQGDDVVVITQAAPGTPMDEVVNGVRVIRVAHDAPLLHDWHSRFIEWTFGFNVAVARAAIHLMREWSPDVVHGHDWLVAQAAVLVQEAGRVPFVLTVHATEAGRQSGDLVTDQSWAIHSTEWWAVHHADRIIVCSDYMEREVQHVLDPPAGLVCVIPNGIDPDDWHVPAARRARVRREYGTPLVVYAGRLEREKGVHTLIDAVPRLRRLVPGARVVVIGEGTVAADLAAYARSKRLGRVVTFTGWVSEADLRATVAAADAAVVPSLYEPFGFVALEAIVLGTPLVVSRTGGLREIVEDGRTGGTFEPGDANALAEALADALLDPRESRRRGLAARADVLRRFAWPVIAERTRDAYRRALSEAGATAGARRPAPAYAQPVGNLLSEDL